MRKLLTTCLAGALTLGGLAGLGSTASAVQTIDFGACPADLATAYPELTCANVQVPLDYARPFGKQVTLLVSKVPAKNPAKRQGSLFVNPGGPGGGAADYVGRLSKPNGDGVTRLPASVLEAYDVIGMDPRGVAHSSPVHCVDPSAFAGPQPDPDNPVNFDAIWKFWGTFAKGCDEKSHSLLPHLGTRNVARDMDTLRVRLGGGKLNYLGFSYGTYLGAVYGEMFPQQVGRMVLDGNMNPEPTNLYYEAGLAQAPAMQARVENWLKWVAQYDSVFHLGKTFEQAKAAWDATLADFRKAPHGQVGANELLSAVFGTMYAEPGWTPLAQALSDYVVKKDDAALVDYAQPATDAGNEQSTAAFNAIACVDTAWPTDRAVWERDGAKAAKVSQFGYYNLWTSAACAQWPVPQESRVLPSGRGLPKILMFNTIGDPATPYAGALKLHKRLPGSVMVTELDSGKHCVFANPIAAVNPDAQRIGADYLVTGALPAKDISIPGHALPVPAAGTQASARTAGIVE